MDGSRVLVTSPYETPVIGCEECDPCKDKGECPPIPDPTLGPSWSETFSPFDPDLYSVSYPPAATPVTEGRWGYVDLTGGPNLASLARTLTGRDGRIISVEVSMQLAGEDPDDPTGPGFFEGTQHSYRLSASGGALQMPPGLVAFVRKQGSPIVTTRELRLADTEPPFVIPGEPQIGDTIGIRWTRASESQDYLLNGAVMFSLNRPAFDAFCHPTCAVGVSLANNGFLSVYSQAEHSIDNLEASVVTIPVPP